MVSKEPIKAMKPLRFAIITNTIRRDRELVEKSLRASLSQAGVDQVILVDQNASTLKISDDLLSQARLQVLPILVPAVSQARNRAVYPAVDWLIFCDDDGYMAHDYVEKLKALLALQPKLEVICGSIKRIDTGDFYSKRHALGGDMSRFWNTKLLMGSNFAVKRETFEALGKFDEAFGAGAKYGSSEETDFAWNAYFNFHRMTFAPELVVFHVPPFEGAFWPEMKKAFRYGRGKSALIRKWLFKGHVTVFFELVEMLIVPILRAIQFLLTFKLKELAIQFAAVVGRICGLFLP
jgi:GT2 family glycosyltransferase